MAQPTTSMAKGGLSKDVVLSRIPAFPPVVLRTLDLLANERTQIRELVREITSDATLSAQVLRLANSALFGFAAQVKTVRHAIVALGNSRVQSLLMTVATTNYMRAALQTGALVKCWRHSLATAVITRELARAAGMEPDRAYTLGLLHDIGRLGLLVGYADAYEEILREADRDSVSLLDLEQRRFGMDHCEAGRILTREWNLPPEFHVVTGRHHDPPESGRFDGLQLVHLACRLSDTLGYSAVVPLEPMRFDEFQELLPPSVRERIPETLQDFAALVAGPIQNENVDTASPAAWDGKAPAYNFGAGIEGKTGAANAGNGAEETMDVRQVLRDLAIVGITVCVFAATCLLLTRFLNN